MNAFVAGLVYKALGYVIGTTFAFMGYKHFSK